MASLSSATYQPITHFSTSSPLGLKSRQLSHFQQPLKSPIGLSFRATRSFGPDKSLPSRLQVLSVRDTKAAVVTSESWDSLILKSDMPVLVEFYASWCGPCRMVHRVIDEIAMDYSGRLKCFILHADDDSQVAEDYDIKAVPVVLLFKNGMKRETVIGTMPKEFYVAAIDRVLAS